MRFIFVLLVIFGFASVDAVYAQETQDHVKELSGSKVDWPWWRGPSRNGIASGDTIPPTSWSESENVLWKTPVPGRGHGSATVVGDKVFITTAELTPERQQVLCLSRKTGEKIWECTVHEGGLKTKGNRKQNKKASLASTTVACDGDQVYVNFLNNEAVWTSAISMDGQTVWQKEITKYVVHQGYGSSPALYQNLVIVTADNKGGGKVAALDRATGEFVWQRDRPKKPNYASPIVMQVAGKTQLILTGCDLVTSLEPTTGKELWETEGATTECVTSSVTDGQNVYSSGGYPKNHISAVAADGSGKLAWENGMRAYVPSLICRDGYLYAVLDAGVATCFRCSDGEEVWKSRLGGTFSSSPVMVGDLIYATNESGETFIFRALPDQFEKVGSNKLGNSVFSTASICDGRIYLRVAHDENGSRQEYLYCIGSK